MRFSLAVFLCMAACGGSGKSGQTAEEPPPTRIMPRQESQNDGLEVEGLKGVLSAEAIRRGVKPEEERLDACYEQNVTDAKFLAGQVTLELAVNRDGSVKDVELTSSDLGSWKVEKCLLEVARGLRFDRPDGGEAQISIPLEFDNARTPALLWTEDQITDKQRSGLDKRLRGCGAIGKEKRAQVTLYVGRRGKVRSVGFAGPKVPDEWKDCAEQIINAETLADPRGAVVKVSFWVPSG